MTTNLNKLQKRGLIAKALKWVEQDDLQFNDRWNNQIGGI